jgi:hypothetical protein
VKKADRAPTGEKSASADSGGKNHWLRMKECADQAERMAKRERWASGVTRLGSGTVDDDFILKNWINHYSEKYDRCYIEIFWTPTPKAADLPNFYRQIYDAFEGNEVSSCAAPGPDGSGGVWCDGFEPACTACRSFEKDHMTN